MSEVPDTIKLEDRPCPVGCTASDKVVLEGHDRLHGIEGRYRVVRCGRCGLMRTNPRPTADSIGAYYPDDYAPYRSSAIAAAEPAGPIARLKKHLALALGLEARQVPPVQPGHMLEIGCAAGAYMNQMRQAGWTAEGIEFSESAAAQARSKGFRVQATSVETAQPPSQAVDLVAAWMVLEHLHKPVEVLARIREWVQPSGYLIASVPDAGSLERRLFGDKWYALQLPTHLYHYTPATLAQVLRVAGWQLCRTRWQRNCNNLLWSLEYSAQDRGWKGVAAWIAQFRTSPRVAKIRLLLSWLLGVTKQSGRMEIWARPSVTRSPVR